MASDVTSDPLGLEFPSTKLLLAPPEASKEMNGLMSKKLTFPSRLVSASTWKALLDSRLMNGLMSRKFTLPSRFTSPSTTGIVNTFTQRQKGF